MSKPLVNFNMLKVKKDKLTKIIRILNEQGKDVLERKITIASLFNDFADTFIKKHENLLKKGE